jgi:hypothetical protein
MFGHAGLCPQLMVYSALDMTFGRQENNGAAVAARNFPSVPHHIEWRWI